MNPQEEKMLREFCTRNYVQGVTPTLDVVGPWEIDPEKLAKVLVELEEKRAPIEHCGVEDCPECNKESFKSGYLTALDDVEKAFVWMHVPIREILEPLRKKHKEA